MRTLLFIIFIFLVSETCLAQISAIRAIEDPEDFAPYYCYGYNNDIFLVSESIHYVDLSDESNSRKYKYVHDNDSLTYCLYSSEVLGTSFWSIWMAAGDSSFNVISIEYDLITGDAKGIDTFEMPVNISAFYFSKPIKHGENVLSIVSSSSRGSLTDRYMLFRFSLNGEISLMATKSEIDSISDQIFGHDWIHDVELFRDDKLILSGSRPFVSIVDFNLDVQNFVGVKVPSKSGIGTGLIHRPKFEVINDTTLIGTANWMIDRSRRFEDVFFKVRIRDDSLFFDSLQSAPNVEGIDKFDVQDLILPNGNVLLASNPDYQVGTPKANFPCSFYLTNINCDEAIWHRLYGGDHYYRMRSIELIDSCKILIAGSVFDYFDNGFLQGFYAIVDCNGDLLTSNVELTEIETTVYPNPTNGPLYLEGIDQGRYVIFDVLGRAMVQGVVDGGEIDLGPIGPGTYFLKIEGSNEVVKFVKE